MSPLRLAAQRRRNRLLASTVLIPVFSLGIAAANAQQAESSNPLPPIEVTAPGDHNRTRAKPVPDEGSGTRRVAPRVSRPADANITPAPGADTSGVPAVRQFTGIVGTSTAVITADEIRQSPALSVQEIIAQTPGVQLQSLYGGVNGAYTSVDLRGFGAFQTSNSLLLINGRRVNDLDMQGVDFSTIPRDSIERIEITKGNSGAVLYGDNAIGGVINIVLKNGVGGPPVDDARRGRRRIVQLAAGEPVGRDQFRTVVDVVLWQRHQVRRLSGQQCARPAQRRRKPQLHHARSHRVPDPLRRRPEAGIPGWPNRRSVDRRQ